MELGFPHPDYLLKYLTAKQLYEWQIYSEVEPFGQPELDTQMSYSRYSQAQATMKKKSGKPFTIDEFSLNTIRESKNQTSKKKPQSIQEMKQTMLSIASYFKKKA